MYVEGGSSAKLTQVTNSPLPSMKLPASPTDILDNYHMSAEMVIYTGGLRTTQAESPCSLQLSPSPDTAIDDVITEYQYGHKASGTQQEGRIGCYSVL